MQKPRSLYSAVRGMETVSCSNCCRTGSPRLKEHLDNATAAASRGDWLAAERELRETQLGAREMRLISLGMRL